MINEVVKVIKKGFDNVKHGKSQSNVLAKVEAIRMKKCKYNLPVIIKIIFLVVFFILVLKS